MRILTIRIVILDLDHRLCGYNSDYMYKVHGIQFRLISKLNV